LPVILLFGSEPFLKEEALDRIKRTVLSDIPQDINCEVFYSEDTNNNFLTSLRSFGFFDKQRLVVLKNIEYLSSSRKNSLIEYIKNPSANTYLVLDSNQTDTHKGILKDISRYAKSIQCNKLSTISLYNWINKRLTLYKKTINKDALELLVELKGSDLRSLASELDKLALYNDQNIVITKDTVEALVGSSITHSVFELVDAINSRNCQKALRIAHSLTKSKKREVEIIGALGWQFKRLWMLKGQLNNFDLASIKKAFERLVKADQAMKSGRKNKKLILELLLIELCRA